MCHLAGGGTPPSRVRPPISKKGVPGGGQKNPIFSKKVTAESSGEGQGPLFGGGSREKMSLCNTNIHRGVLEGVLKFPVGPRGPQGTVWGTPEPPETAQKPVQGGGPPLDRNGGVPDPPARPGATSLTPSLHTV